METTLQVTLSEIGGSHVPSVGKLEQSSIWAQSCGFGSLLGFIPSKQGEDVFKALLCVAKMEKLLLLYNSNIFWQRLQKLQVWELKTQFNAVLDHREAIVAH